MICRNCGTEIADKAIVCYRCGTGTKEPLRKPAEIRRRRTPVWMVLVIILAILLALILSQRFHLIGLHVAPALIEPWTSALLIDFASIHA